MGCERQAGKGTEEKVGPESDRKENLDSGGWVGLHCGRRVIGGRHVRWQLV